jgi:hypothetical protein
VPSTASSPRSRAARSARRASSSRPAGTPGWRIQRDTAAYGTQYAADPEDWTKGAKPAGVDEVGARAAQAERSRDA